MPERKGQNLKEIKSVSPLFIPLLTEIWAAITLKSYHHFKSWQTFCQLDSLIVSLATTSKLYCWALNQQCSKSLGLGRELLPLGHRVELEYILCLSRSISCDSCESPALCPLDAALWTVMAFLPDPQPREGGRRWEAARRASLWRETGVTGRESLSQGEKKNETRTEQV